MLKKFFLYSTILSIIFLSFCDQNNQKKLLKIGSKWIYTEDFFSINPRHTYKFLPASEQEQTVNDFIDRQLIIYDALKKGCLKNDDLKAELYNLKTKMLIGAYFEKFITDSIITKDMLLSAYETLDPMKKELFTYDEYKPIIKDQFISKYNQQIEAAYFKTIENIKTKNNLVVFTANIDSLSKQYSIVYRKFMTESSTIPSPRDILNNIRFDQPVYSINDKSYNFSDFKAALKTYPYSIPDRLSNSKIFENAIENIILNDIVITISKRHKYFKNNDFRQNLKIKTDALLYKYYINNEIKNKITKNDDSLFVFFQANKDSLYMTNSLYEVHEIYIKDKNIAEQILFQAQTTDNFKNLSDKYTERYIDRPEKGYLGFISSDKYSIIGKTAAVTKAGTVYPELIKSGNGYSIIKVLSVKEPELINFEENKDRIYSDYYRYKFSFLKLELLKRLKDKYPYKIDASKLK